MPTWTAPDNTPIGPGTFLCHLGIHHCLRCGGQIGKADRAQDLCRCNRIGDAA